jgi:hypothetical protein
MDFLATQRYLFTVDSDPTLVAQTIVQFPLGDLVIKMHTLSSIPAKELRDIGKAMLTPVAVCSTSSPLSLVSPSATA